MSQLIASETPDGKPGKRSPFKFLMNGAVVVFFAVGIVVSAGSFGLFGCGIFDRLRERRKPVEPPVKTGEMPPLPSPPK
jgi:hypothetical protein